MKAGLLFSTTLAIATTAWAAPTPDALRSRSLVSNSHGRRQIPPFCALDGLDSVTLPVANPALPSPGKGFFLVSIQIGRGVQNYTCGNDPTAAPVANGAVATLYDASCIAVNDPGLLASLPAQVLALPLPNDPKKDLICGPQPLKPSGVHFFNSAKTPVFDFRGTDDEQLGLGLMTVSQRSPAPNPANDVAWLFLTRVDGSEGPVQSIYRVNTAGGVAPATCAGQPASISVQYATQYWVFSKDP